jgi:hypothetical protein
MIRMGAGPVPHGVVGYDAWAARVRALLAPPALLELRAWLAQLSRGLDVYYDVHEQVTLTLTLTPTPTPTLASTSTTTCTSR